MLNVQNINNSKFTVKIVGKPPTLPTSLENEIEDLWLEEQERREKTIFNGCIMSATNVSCDGIVGHIVEYRHLIAQRARPDLFDVLRIRPVAVSGLLECSDGIVFGRRASAMTQDAGLWELLPSGGIDTSNITFRGSESADIVEIDFRCQILTELSQEIGIKFDNLSAVRPFCLVEDTDSHVIDIGIMLKLPLSYNEIQGIYRDIATREYNELQIIPRLKIDNLIQRDAGQFVGVSVALVQHFCNLWQCEKLK